MATLIAALVIFCFSLALLTKKRGRTFKILGSLVVFIALAVVLDSVFGPSWKFRSQWKQTDNVQILAHEHVRSGFEDHSEYWKIRLAKDGVDGFIAANRLVPADHAADIPINLVSWMKEDAPPWWPAQPNNVFVRRDELDFRVLLIADGEYYAFSSKE